MVMEREIVTPIADGVSGLGRSHALSGGLVALAQAAARHTCLGCPNSELDYRDYLPKRQ